MDNHTADDIYIWVTQVPDEVLLSSKNVVIVDYFLGLIRIGRMKASYRGVYLSSFVPTHLKVTSWIKKLILTQQNSDMMALVWQLKK